MVWNATLFLQLALLASMTLNGIWIASDLMSPDAAAIGRHQRKREALHKGQKSASEKLAIQGKFCGQDKDKELVAHLRNIVLIINSNRNQSSWTSGVFMREIYKRFFDNIVLLGPKSIPEYDIEAWGHDPRGWSRWWFAYFQIPSIVAKYPEAEGYLWLEDDVVLNYWSLLRANKSRLWMPDRLPCKHCEIFIPFYEHGIEDAWDGWSADPIMRRRAMHAISRIEKKHIEAWKDSILPKKEGYFKKVVDAFYIPKHFAEAIAFDLLPVFREHSVFSEIAIPAMFGALDMKNNFDPIFDTMAYIAEDEELGQGLRNWNEGMSAYHPWRPSTLAYKEKTLETLSKGDSCLKEFIPLLRNASIFPTSNRT